MISGLNVSNNKSINRDVITPDKYDLSASGLMQSPDISHRMDNSKIGECYDNSKLGEVYDNSKIGEENFNTITSSIKKQLPSLCKDTLAIEPKEVEVVEYDDENENSKSFQKSLNKFGLKLRIPKNPEESQDKEPVKQPQTTKAKVWEYQQQEESNMMDQNGSFSMHQNEMINHTHDPSIDGTIHEAIRKARELK